MDILNVFIDIWKWLETFFENNKKDIYEVLYNLFKDLFDILLKHIFNLESIKA